MTWLDIGILVSLGITTFFGLRIGLIKAVLDLAGLIVGVILAGRFYAPLAGVLTFIPNENIAKVVAFILILIAVIIITGELARLVKGFASIVKLNWLNHLSGAVFGLVWGVIIIGALLTAWITFTGITGDIYESRLAVILVDYFPLVLALLPDEFAVIRSYLP